MELWAEYGFVKKEGRERLEVPVNAGVPLSSLWAGTGISCLFRYLHSGSYLAKGKALSESKGLDCAGPIKSRLTAGPTDASHFSLFSIS